MIAFILAKFINTVGPRSVASNAVKVKLNPQHGLKQYQQSTRMCDSNDEAVAVSSVTFGGSRFLNTDYYKLLLLTRVLKLVKC